MISFHLFGGNAPWGSIPGAAALVSVRSLQKHSGHHTHLGVPFTVFQIRAALLLLLCCTNLTFAACKESAFISHRGVRRIECPKNLRGNIHPSQVTKLSLLGHGSRSALPAQIGPSAISSQKPLLATELPRAMSWEEGNTRPKCWCGDPALVHPLITLQE